MIGKLLLFDSRLDRCEHNLRVLRKKMQLLDHIVLLGKQVIFRCRNLKGAMSRYFWVFKGIFGYSRV